MTGSRTTIVYRMELRMLRILYFEFNDHFIEIHERTNVERNAELTVKEMPANYHCCMVGCTSDSRKSTDKWPNMIGVSFHAFPGEKTDISRRQEWIRLIRRAEWKPNKYSRVCSLHFVGGRGPVGDVKCPTLFPYNNYKLTKTRGTNVSRSLESSYLKEGFTPDTDPCVILEPFQGDIIREEEIPVVGEIIVEQQTISAKISRSLGVHCRASVKEH